MAVILFYLYIILSGLCPSVDDLGQTTLTDHAIYLSTIEMNIEDNQIKMTVKVFANDLLDALHNFHGHSIDTTATSFEEEVESYFKDHIIINGAQLNQVDLHISSSFQVGDSYQIYLRGSLSTKPSHLLISADYFMNLFPTQQNILQLIDGDKKVFHIFKNGGKSFEYKA